MIGPVNLLPKTDDEAKLIHDSLGSNWWAGVVLGDFSRIEDAVDRAERWAAWGIPVSIGLGDGDPKQWRRALDAALGSGAPHLNQPWACAGYAWGVLSAGRSGTVVNALVSPYDGTTFRVQTSPERPSTTVLAPIEFVLQGLGVLGVPSVKYFPLRGDGAREMVKTLAETMARTEGPKILEPSGGMQPTDLSWLMDLTDSTGVVVIPHIYSAMRDESGKIDRAKVKVLQQAINGRRR